MNAILALEDGSVFEGEGFGAATTVVGEAVFNTSMTGYQEMLTDPSYHGQILTLTAPQIGNVGVNAEDVESAAPQVQALVVREISPIVSNWRAAESLPAYLARHGIPGVSEVDTRGLTRCLRERGTMKAALSTAGLTADELVDHARAWPGLEGRDTVSEVSCRRAYPWQEGTLQPFRPAGSEPAESASQGSQRKVAGPLHVVAYDFGIRRNILRRFVDHGCRVTVVPADTPADAVLALSPDGVFLSNGPGDPAGLPYAAQAVSRLLARNLPIFGICLGHQILALAAGGRTYKLKFGHHGGNQPVRSVDTGRVLITSQNHNYAVDPGSLPVNQVEVTEWNLNDGTVEGLRFCHLPVFSVQYHPEASPGPHDADRHFRAFLALMGGSGHAEAH